MATTITPQGKFYLGPAGSIDYGIWSTDGSTTATITVTSGMVLAAYFTDANQNMSAQAGTTDTATLSAKSTSGGITTYTLTPGGSAITNGTYFIIHGGQ